jgi:hypothetical protein
MSAAERITKRLAGKFDSIRGVLVAENTAACVLAMHGASTKMSVP